MVLCSGCSTRKTTTVEATTWATCITMKDLSCPLNGPTSTPVQTRTATVKSSFNTCVTRSCEMDQAQSKK